MLINTYISEQQITQLYKFTKDRYIETELVDHLADDIEGIWKENPNLSFDKAKNNSFKKFGIFGFYNIIKSKHNALGKKYWILVWKYFIEFFNLPKIILIIFIIGIVYSIFNLSPNKDIALYVLSGLLYA